MEDAGIDLEKYCDIMANEDAHADLLVVSHES